MEASETDIQSPTEHDIAVLRGFIALVKAMRVNPLAVEHSKAALDRIEARLADDGEERA